MSNSTADTDLSFVFPEQPRVIAIGDVHGDLARLLALLMGTKIINDKFQWTAEPKNTWVVQVGDQLDSKIRDPQATEEWETTADVQVVFFMRSLDREARRHGGRVISLLGNHELLNVLGDLSYVSQKSMNMLGGPQNRVATFRPGQFMAKVLADRPVVVQIGNFVFCHAGLLPEHIAACKGNIDNINALMRKYLLGEALVDPEQQRAFATLFIDGDAILWTRQALLQTYHTSTLPSVLDALHAKAMVIGHNPMLGGIVTTPAYNLWFVDTGLSRVFGGSLQCLEILDGGVPSPQNNHQPIRILTIVKN